MEKVVLITGASAGIGLATADLLHSSGWTVIGASRRGKGPGTWQSMVMDVDDDVSVTDGVNSVIAEHGRIDAVVACAGWGLAGAVEQTPIADAQDQFQTNFWGAVRVVQSVLPCLRLQASGRIILVSSIGGVVGIPFQAFYTASKFAMEGYGEALAYEVAPFGIEVTLVEPGNIRTDFTSSRRNVVPVGPDVYALARTKAVEKMEEDERNGAPAADVARAIAGALESSLPRRRISVGKMGERVGIIGKRLLPYRLFEAGAKGSLGL